MIRREVFKQLTEFTYILESDEKIGLEVFKQLELTKFTYSLETDEEEETG